MSNLDERDKKLKKELGVENAYSYFSDYLKVNPKKLELCIQTLKGEGEITSLSLPQSFSLYISIPFCPTRCSYCSFVSHSIKNAFKLIPDYVNQICEELITTANIAKQNNLQADFYVASEAGITNLLGEWIDINAVVIEDAKEFQSVGISQGFQIPEKYVQEIRETELGKVMDKIFEKEKLGQGKGGINLLTKGEVSRIELTKNAFIMALISHINGEIWK